MAESLMSAGGGGLTNSKLALANAAAGDVIKGKTFYAGDKNLKTGTMEDRGNHQHGRSVAMDSVGFYIQNIPEGYYHSMGADWGPHVGIPLNDFYNYFGGNHEAWSTTINPGGSVVIPKGFHNGSGRVNANMPAIQDLIYIYDPDLSPYLAIFLYRNGESGFIRHYSNSNGGVYSDELIRIVWDGNAGHWFWNIYANRRIGYWQDGGSPVYINAGQAVVENMDHSIIRSYKFWPA